MMENTLRESSQEALWRIDDYIHHLDEQDRLCQDNIEALEEEHDKTRPKLKIQELAEVFPEAQEVLREQIAETIVKLKDVWERIQKSVEHYTRDMDAKPICQVVIEIIEETERRPLEARLNRLEYNLSVLTGRNKSDQIDVEELKDRVDLQEIVQRYGIKSRKIGRERISQCPFHHDKTPSFTFSKRLFYCFGCGKSGDVIAFVEEMDQCDFREAIRRLV